MTFNPDLPVQTRDGRKARIICTDMKTHDSPHPEIIALVDDGDGAEIIQEYTQEGHVPASVKDMPYDLINIPEKRWLNVYDRPYEHSSPIGVLYGSRKAADIGSDSGANRIACIEFTEGDGLK